MACRPNRLRLFMAVSLLSILPARSAARSASFVANRFHCEWISSSSTQTATTAPLALSPRSSEEFFSPPSPEEMRPAGYSCLRWGGIVEGGKEGSTTACTFPLRRVDGSTMHPIRCFGFSTTSSTEAARGRKEGRPIDICVREIPFSVGKLAGTAWYAGVALAQYFAVHPDMVRNKSVLELGSGVGVVGIMAAKLGAREVFLTDFGYDQFTGLDGATAPPPAKIQTEDMSRLLPLSALENIRFNADMNGASSVARVERLDWNNHVVGGQGVTFSLPPRGVDLIVGSDLVYDENAAGPLIKTLKYFLRRVDPKVKALLMLPEKDRKALPTFLEMLRNDDAIEFSVERMVLVDRRAPEKELLMVTIMVMK